MRLTDLTLEYLESLKPRYLNNGYNIPKWIIASEELIKRGWSVKAYYSKTTVSKYIYARKNEKIYKIRFSNHKPSVKAETYKDCDFYVGVSNKGCLTTEKLLEILEK